MANLNFPPATPGVPGPEYTLNGIVYYWDGEKWTANNEDGFTEVFVNVDGDNMTGDLTLGTDKITLDATDGTAEFASGQFTVNSNGRASSIGPIGGFHVNDINGTNAAFAVSDSDGTNTYCTIMGDGSATFANNVSVAENSDLNGPYIGMFPGSGTTSPRINTLSPGNGTSVFNVYSQGALSDTITLLDNGTAMFTGGITNSYNYISSTSTNPNGWVARADTGLGTVFSLYATGSAEFAGSLSANSGKVVTYTYNSGLYLDVRQLGWVGVNVLTNGEGKENACIKLSNGTPGSSFLIAGYGQGNSEVYSVTNQGTVGTRNVLFQLEPDNDANYTATTDSEGNETRVYNGPTLDVKERLTKADTALQTLKSAAAAAVDFAELKAAIATALADI